MLDENKVGKTVLEKATASKRKRLVGWLVDWMDLY